MDDGMVCYDTLYSSQGFRHGYLRNRRIIHPGGLWYRWYSYSILTLMQIRAEVQIKTLLANLVLHTPTIRNDMIVSKRAAGFRLGSEYDQ
eukprot:scaffold1893_cov220-Amphora_coffeaeformis.AAC.11